MRLSEAKTGRLYQVQDIRTGEEVRRRLEALGLAGQARVAVLQEKRGGSMILRVRGTRLAVGRFIAGQIQVRETV